MKALRFLLLCEASQPRIIILLLAIFKKSPEAIKYCYETGSFAERWALDIIIF